MDGQGNDTGRSMAGCYLVTAVVDEISRLLMVDCGEAAVTRRRRTVGRAEGDGPSSTPRRDAARAGAEVRCCGTALRLARVGSTVQHRLPRAQHLPLLAPIQGGRSRSRALAGPTGLTSIRHTTMRRLIGAGPVRKVRC